jgi:hypothetical protein
VGVRLVGPRCGNLLDLLPDHGMLMHLMFQNGSSLETDLISRKEKLIQKESPPADQAICRPFGNWTISRHLKPLPSA